MTAWIKGCWSKNMKHCRILNVVNSSWITGLSSIQFCLYISERNMLIFMTCSQWWSTALKKRFWGRSHMTVAKAFSLLSANQLREHNWSSLTTCTALWNVKCWIKSHNCISGIIGALYLCQTIKPKTKLCSVVSLLYILKKSRYHVMFCLLALIFKFLSLNNCLLQMYTSSILKHNRLLSWWPQLDGLDTNSASLA